MQRTFCGALGVCAFLAMLACVSGELRADSFLDKIYTTPDYCQTDSAYGGFPDPNPPYEDHGGVFCGPCSVSNSLMWLDDNGFPNLAANTAVRKYDQHELIETIASAEYTNSYYHDGLNPTRLATGVSSYIHDCGYEYSRFEFQSWRDVPAAFDTGIDRPNLDWARAGIASPTGVVLWSVGWYDYHPSTKSYTREGGHWVTMVGYDDDHLIIHDPSPRTGYDLVNNYVTPTLITDPQVTFPGGNAAGYYLLSGWPINSVGDYAILDGVFVIEMIPANYAPVAVDDPKVEFVEDYRADEDNAIHTYAYNGVLVNDSDVDGDDLSAYQFSAPAHGTVALDSTGWFTYTPDANYHGTDSFTYRAFDGELYSDPATVNLDIVSVNDVPVAVEDTYEVDENGVLHTYVYNGVLENDTDADNTDLDPANDTLSAVLESDPAHGQLTFSSTGWFTYTPDTDFSGTDSFTYLTFDGTDYSEPGTVVIDVLAALHIPGDATGDGRVDGADSTRLAANWGKDEASWSMGDFDDDGVVGPKDAAILASNWGYGPSEAAAVPEPGVLAYGLSLLLIGLCRRRRG